jgi:hypothetical protein
MRQELSKDMFETLWQDEEFVLSRSVQEAELSSLLVVAPALTQPAPRSPERLEHAYALRDALDPAWAARPLALVRQALHNKPSRVVTYCARGDSAQ